ncbi:hypothetical protein D3C77_385910 [compost metagenome]
MSEGRKPVTLTFSQIFWRRKDLNEYITLDNVIERKTTQNGVCRLVGYVLRGYRAVSRFYAQRLGVRDDDHRSYFRGSSVSIERCG